MAKLVYTAITSLDGCTTDASGAIGWGVPDPVVHGRINDLERDIGTYLYGRRMYQSMVYWETFEAAAGDPPELADFTALWRAADKIVYSSTLDAVSGPRTRIERNFDPEVVRHLVASSPHDVSIGGAGLAGQALAAGLVDEVHLFVAPVSVGGGTDALPVGVHLELELVAVDRFASGFVHLHYRTDS